MSLFFRYKVVPMNSASVSLGGRWSRPRPLLIASVMGPNGTEPTQGLLDTGSDETLLSTRLASRVGLDLSNAATSQLRLANGSHLHVRYAQVTLRLTDGRERREWPAWVGFAPGIPRSLFGFAGFLQFFTATFHGDREQIELTVNGLYPGT